MGCCAFHAAVPNGTDYQCFSYARTPPFFKNFLSGFQTLSPSRAWLHIGQRISSIHLCPLSAPPPPPTSAPGISDPPWWSLASSSFVFPSSSFLQHSMPSLVLLFYPHPCGKHVPSTSIFSF